MAGSHKITQQESVQLNTEWNLFRVDRDGDGECDVDPVPPAVRNAWLGDRRGMNVDHNR